MTCLAVWAAMRPSSSGSMTVLALLGVDLAGVAVDGDDDACFFVVVFLDGQLHGLLDAVEDDVAGDVLFAVQQTPHHSAILSRSCRFLYSNKPMLSRANGHANKKSGTCPTRIAMPRQVRAAHRAAHCAAANPIRHCPGRGTAPGRLRDRTGAASRQIEGGEYSLSPSGNHGVQCRPARAVTVQLAAARVAKPTGPTSQDVPSCSARPSPGRSSTVTSSGSDARRHGRRTNKGRPAERRQSGQRPDTTAPDRQVQHARSPRQPTRRPAGSWAANRGNRRRSDSLGRSYNVLRPVGLPNRPRSSTTTRSPSAIASS